MGRKKQTQNTKKIGAIIAGAALLLSMFQPILIANAQVPQTINYQSRLRTIGGVPITATTTIQFSLYNHISNGSSGDAPGSAGPLLWKETYDQASGACGAVQPDAQGYFFVQLGSCVSFPAYIEFDSPLYLGVKIEADAEAAPRVLLASFPYALNSQRVNSLEATTTATGGQLLALENDLSFDIATGTYFGGGLSITGTSTLQNLTFTVATGTSLNLSNYLAIGAIRLDSTGTNNITSGAYLVGVFDEFTNSNATTVQAALFDLDTAITAVSSSLFAIDLQQVTDNGNTTTNAIQFAGATSTGDILPGAHDTYSLGNTDLRWSDIWSGIVHVGTSTWDLTQSNNAAFTISQNGGSERMRIESNGRVGIGTNQPEQMLSIRDNLLIGQYEGIIPPGGKSANLILRATDGFAPGIQGSAYTTFQRSSADIARIGINTLNSINFDYWDGLSWVSRMMINSGGYIGMGTVTPTSTLHVVAPYASTTAITTIENDAGDYQTFNVQGSPEGHISGSIGDIAMDVSLGNMYVKVTGNSTSTGWERVFTSDTGLVTLDTAYDGGGSGAGRFIISDAGPIQITNTTGTLGFLSVTHSTNAEGLWVNNLGNGSAFSARNMGAGSGFYTRNQGTGYGARLDNSTDDGVGLFIDNPVDGIGLRLANAGNNYGALIENTGGSQGIRIENGTNSGYGLYVNNTQLGQGIYVDNPSQGNAIVINNTGNRTGLRIINADAGLGGYIRNDLGTGLEIDHNSDFYGLHINNNAAGYGMYVSSADGTGIFVEDLGSKSGVKVHTTTGSGNMLELQNDDDARAIYIAHQGTQEGFWMRNTGTGSSLWIEDEAVDTSPFVLDADGYLGIGTATPGYILDVVGDARIYDQLMLGQYGSLPVSGNEDGAVIYNTSSSTIHYWDGSEWIALLGASASTSQGWLTTGNIGTNLATNFLGTIDNQGLAFRTNNVQNMLITADGHVGIGSAVGLPSHILEVGGDDGFAIMDNGGDQLMEIIGNLGAGSAVFKMGDILAVDTNTVFTISPSSSRFTFMAGDVGIGTLTPSTLLHVQGGSNGSALLTLDSDDGSASGMDAGIVINSDNNNGSDAAYLIFKNNGVQSVKFLGGTTGSGFDLAGGTTFNITQSGFSRLHMTDSGNFGFATDTPAYVVDVLGDARLSAQLMLGRYAVLPGSGNQSGAVVYNTASSTVHYWDGATWRTVATAEDVRSSLWDVDHDTGVQVEESADEDRIRFDTAGVERMYIRNDGYVGIGTTAPLVSLLTVGPDSHEASTFSVSGITGMLNIANFRDENGENVFRAGGSVAGNDLVVGFGDLDYGGIGTSMQVNYGDNAIELSHSDLRFSDMSGGEYVGFISPAVLATNTIWTLPGADGANNQVLITDGAGTLSWATSSDLAYNIYNSDGFIPENRNVTIAAGQELRFLDQGNSANFVYIKPDYNINGNLRIGAVNNDEGNTNHYLEFMDNFKMVSQHGIEIDAGTNQIDMYGDTGIFTIGGANQFYDLRAAGSRYGLRYQADYSSDFVARSLVDKGYVDNKVASSTNNIYGADGYLASDRIVNGIGRGLNVSTTNGGYFDADIRDGSDLGFVHVRSDELELNVANPSAYSGMVFNSGGVSFTHNGSGSTTQFYIGSNMMLTDSMNLRGIEYAADYSANYTNRTLVDKEYVDSVVASSSLLFANGLVNTTGTVELGGSMTKNTNIDLATYRLQFNATDGYHRIADDRTEFAYGYSYFTAEDVGFEVEAGDENETVNYYMRNNLFEISGYTSTSAINPNFHGATYGDDYSAYFVDRSLVDKEYVDNAIFAATTTLQAAYDGGGSALGRQIFTLNNANPVEIINPGIDQWETGFALSNAGFGGGLAFRTQNSFGDHGARIYFTDDTDDPENGTGSYMDWNEQASAFEFGYQTAGTRNSSFYIDYNQMALNVPGTSSNGALGILATNYNVPVLRLAVPGPALSNMMRMSVGTSTPEARVTGESGSVFFRTDGTGSSQQLYVKTTDVGNTGWFALAGADSNHWQKNTNVLSPTDSGVYQIAVTNNNASTLTGFKAVNTNDVSNYAGAVVEMKGSGADYTNNMYFGKYGAAFWIPTWAGNGVLATDKNLILGAVGGSSIIRYQIGGGYSAPVTVATMDSNSMDLSAGVSLTVGGNTVLGDATSDTVTYNARVGSHIIPSTNNTYDLGSPALSWRNIYASGTIYGNVVGYINPGYTEGSVIFQGASSLQQDNTNFHWDDTVNRLLLGSNATTSAIGRKLDVRSNVSGGQSLVYLYNGSGGGGGRTLHVSNDAGNANEAVLIDNRGTGAGLSILNGGSGNVNGLLVDSGRVGFGTTTPAFNLDLVGDARLSAQLMLGRYALNPATGNQAGAVIYNTASSTPFFWDGSEWIALGGSGATAGSLWDTDHDTGIQVEESADEDIIRFDTAGTEYFTIQGPRLSVLNSGNSVFMGQDAGRVDDLTTNNNVFVGRSAGYSNTSGFSNVYIGYEAGYAATTQESTVAIGREAGRNNTGAFGNTMLGYYAGASNTGNDNVMIGYESGVGNTGGDNFFMGRGTGWNNTGSQNIMMGYFAGYDNKGSSNILFGSNAGSSNKGTNGIFMGANAGYYNIGNDNIFLGYYAGGANATGTRNLFLGREAGFSNVLGNGNIFLGYQAGYSETNSNRLYIDNSNTSAPLVYGEFDTNVFRINGALQINNPSSTGYALPVSDGNSGQILVTNGNGNVAWASTSVLGTDTLQDVTDRGATTTNWIQFAGATSVGDIIPSIHDTYSLGNTDYRWSDLWSGIVHVGTSTWDLAQADNGAFTISQRDNGEMMRVTTDGYVGIGTEVPEELLSLNDDMLIGQFDGSIYPIGGYNRQLIIRATDGQLAGTQGTAYTTYQRNGVNYARVGLDTSNNINFGHYNGSWSNQVVISTSGNMGIGVFTPYRKLDVQGSTTPGDNLFRIGGGANGAYISMYASTTDDRNSVIEVQRNLDFFSQTNHIMSLANSGDVGIGTFNPSYSLDVVGDARLSAELLLGQYATNPVSGSAPGSLIYNSSDDLLYFWDNSEWRALLANGDVTLDEAYDAGGAGLGRQITADSGAVYLTGAGNGTALQVGYSGSGEGVLLENSGAGIGFRMSQTGSGPAMYIRQNDGRAIDIDNNTANSGVTINNSDSGDGIAINNNGSSGNGMRIDNDTDGAAIYIEDTIGKSAINIVKTGSSGDLIRMSNLGTGDGIDLTHASSGKAIRITNTGTGDSLFINDSAADTSPFVLTANGDLGIGATTPDARLEITGDNSLADVKLLKFQASNDADIQSEIYFSGGSNATYWNVNSSGNGGALAIYDGTTEVGKFLNNGFIINDGSAAGVDFRVESDTNTHAMFVDATNGYVGFDQSVPLAKLHVGNTTAGSAADYNYMRLQGTGDVDHRLYIPTGSNLMIWDYNVTGNGGAIEFRNGSSRVGMFTNSGLVVNEGGVTGVGLRVEGDTNANLLYTDATNDRVGVGTSAPDARFHVEQSGNIVAVFDRTTSDGTIISFHQGGVEEGTISVSADTISYNAFTGSHYAWTNENIEKGMLVSLTGENRNLHNNVNSEIMYGVTIATEVNDAKIMGSYLSLQEPGMASDEHNPHLIMAVGNGEAWVADKGENINIGDYFISSDIAGHAEKDTGEFMVSHIVARAAESVDWTHVSTQIDGVKHKKISVFFESFDKNNIQDSVAGTSLQGGEETLETVDLVVADAVFEGNITVKGHVAYGKDVVGQAMIMTGDNRVTVEFVDDYGTLPIVTLTPAGKVTVPYWVENASLQGFDIVLGEVQYADILFNWHAFGNNEGRVYVSNGTTMEIIVNDMGSSDLETELNALGQDVADPGMTTTTDEGTTDVIVDTQSSADSVDDSTVDTITDTTIDATDETSTVTDQTNEAEVVEEETVITESTPPDTETVVPETETTIE